MPDHARAPQSQGNLTSSAYDPDLGMCVDESQDFGSNELQNSRVGSSSGSPDDAALARQKEAVENMGDVQALDGNFYTRAGACVDALVPNVGDKGKLQINVNVPVDSTGTVKASFEFVTELERDDKGVKGRVQLGGGVTASKKVDAYFVTLEVFAQAKVFGYMEAYGDRGAEIFRLLSLGIRQRIAGASDTLADAIFDRATIDDTVRAMDEDDYVESGLGVDVSVGASAKDGSDEALGAAGAGVQASTGTKLEARNGQLQGTDVSQLQVRLNGSADPFAVEGKLTGKFENGSLAAIEGELAGEAMMGGEQLSELVLGGRWLSGVISDLGGVVSGGSGMLPDAGAARQASALGSFIANNSGASVAAEAAAVEAVAELDKLGVKVGHKLTIKGVWNATKGFGLGVDLERVRQIEFGDNPRDLVYVLLENVQSVFRIKVGAA